MSYRGREIESKFEVRGLFLWQVNAILEIVVGEDKRKMLFGSSADTYWILPETVDADFIRMRERDGCVQVTVKAKDRGSNRNRMEKEFSTTDNIEIVEGVLTAAHGEPSGILKKTYYVYWVTDYDTVCCYSIQDRGYEHIIIEAESTRDDRLLALEARITKVFERRDAVIEKVPWSLYERFICGDQTK